MIPEWFDFSKQIVFILFCAICLWTDIRSRLVYNYITIPILIFAWLASLYSGGLANSLYGTLLAAVLFLPGVYFDKIGAGDLKFAAAAGALLGWRGFAAAVLIAGVIGLSALIFRSGTRKADTGYPLALFLVPGAVAARLLTGYINLIL